MKKLNKKGFTLIELLAVIVILAILIAVAVPAITRYLASARANTFKDNALSVIEAVRKDKIINGGETTTYTLSEINGLLEKKLNKSPYGEDYGTSSCVKVTTDVSTGTDTYLICLTDGKYGIKGTEDEIMSGKRGTGEQETEVKVTSMESCTCD